jgi:hypothetical protein
MAVWQPELRYQEPPSELRDLVDLVLGDLQGSEPIAVQVGVGPKLRLAGLSRYGPRGSADPAAWGQACPLCPGHFHPAEPRLIDGDAWWTCPRDGHEVARFGALGDTNLA